MFYSCVKCSHYMYVYVCTFSQDKSVYLLDNPLAAVDSHVASHLFSHCIMGLLRHKIRVNIKIIL